MIRVPRPRIMSVRRIRPDQISLGDSAEARLDPGLLRLLDHVPEFHARYNLPVSLAPTAANAILAPSLSNWAGRDLEVEWSGAPDPHDIVLASATLEEYSPRLARFRIEGRTLTGKPLFTGVLRMLARRDGLPVGFRSNADYEALRARLAQARAEPMSQGSTLKIIFAPKSIPLGRSAEIEIEIHQTGPVVINARAPYGAGLSFDSAKMHRLEIAPGETARVSFMVRADRPHEVNLGKPWKLTISTTAETIQIPILVPDPNPGRSFYLLTEDCETFDGGPRTGAYTPPLSECGNHNNWMDPEDYRIQMVLKPDRMNQIAERHGARWTHFYAATQCFGAMWAASKSNTGEWPKVLAEIEQSIRDGCRLHEYSPHIHFDYEPDSALPPQPRLLYDAATDGILPNDYYHAETNPTHRYHDWDGAARGGTPYVKPFGDWTDLDSKSGSMRKSLHYLARLQANRRTPLVARTGSYDFGGAAKDQTISTQAYEANGLRGNSDVYRHWTPPVSGGQLYWCQPQDRHQPITDLRQARLLQFGIPMENTFESAEEMNRWFAEHWALNSGPGVHAILFTTHAMFWRGEPDPFRSLEGGAFEQFDRHLSWVRKNYPEVEFATASEVQLEYLDYYSPTLDSFTEPRLCGGDPSAGFFEFPVRLLGRGIRVDEQHPAALRIAAPPCFCPSDLAEMRLLLDGELIATQTLFDSRFQPLVSATIQRRGAFRLQIQAHLHAIDSLAPLYQDGFYEPTESAEPDLFRLRPATREGRYSADLLRLLMNPVAGNTEPLGRRIHPMGGLTIGIALHAALGQAEPLKLKLRWVKEVDAGWSYLAHTETGANGTMVRISDDSGILFAEAEVVAKHHHPA